MKSIQIIATLLFSAFSFQTFAQQTTDTTLNGELNEVTVTALKFSDKKKFVAGSSEKINIAKNALSGTLADVLQNSGAVFMQKSQGGGGSPSIRGFEASRVLMMVDGVRMNNAMYRAGHHQYLITVDPNTLDYAEVIYGPNSTLYGSDALGGVISFVTRNPILSSTDKTIFKTNVATRYASASSEYNLHADLNIGSKQWASFTSFTFAKFGDLTKGSNGNDYPGFGDRTFYVQRFEINRDSVVTNPDPKKQLFTGYDQFDILQKLLYKPTANEQHLLNIQYSQSSDIPRYDRLTEKRNGLPRFAEWYYGPQKRLLVGYNLDLTLNQSYFQQFKLVGSYQYVEESRISRNFNSFNKDFRIEKMNVLALTVDAKHIAADYELHVGADVQFNILNSTAYRQNIATLVTANSINTRYPDAGNNMDFAALYFSHIWKLSKQFTATDGARLNYVKLKSDFTPDNVLRLPYSQAAQSNLALSGNIGLIFHPNNRFKTALHFSTGFRAPNVDDLSKVFESAGGTLIVPNPDLQPEQTYNAEWNATFIKSKFLQVEVAAWYTWFKNAIVTAPFANFPGAPTVIYQGVPSTVLANQNASKAFLYGFSFSGIVQIADGIKANARAAYNYGRFTRLTGEEIPLDHISPFYGRLGLDVQKEKWNASLFAVFNAWKRIADYNPDGEDNQIYATADGMPAWTIVNFNAHFQVIKNVAVQVGVENILDRDYRTFGSGISGAGRNFIIGLKGNF
jgi:hemoglobin/transferrin/lactoferrin receptor protein